MTKMKKSAHGVFVFLALIIWVCVQACTGTDVTTAADADDDTATESADAWTQRADFSGGARFADAGFAVGGKGYVGTGNNGEEFLDDFWEYDPETDTWTQKQDFPGGARRGDLGLAADDKGYIVTGYNGPDGPQEEGTGTFYNDFWEYDPVTDSWERKADFSGPGRRGAAGFVLGGKLYVGTGWTHRNFFDDFWEYDPVSETWTRKANFGGTGRGDAVAFAAGGKGYIGLGWTITPATEFFDDFWEYDPVTDTWTEIAGFGSAIADMVSFEIGDRGYVTGGMDDEGNFFTALWEFDPETGTWTMKAEMSGTPFSEGIGFSIDDKGYVGTGNTATGLSDEFLEYRP